ncbi:putative signal recognition particle subunit SRP14 [Paratrimastix pyriformis]|uniref:Signal recognition particle 14 kDa protein n=1 Tax=Paratrimastix pyriformis TaxID=342808 RepID=A0ABQ8UGI8_9EUKA|nr:putative signal recognition particle subunit SRP14 [Paratrimastix pyriformis]
MLLDAETFLHELSRLFGDSRESGSVNITFKQLTGANLVRAFKGKPEAASADPHDVRCIIHAKGPHARLSTIIGARDVVRFQISIAALFKTNMINLKKKERKPKAPKKKAE